MDMTTLLSFSTTENWLLRNVTPMQFSNGTNGTESGSYIELGTIIQCGILFLLVILTIIGNIIVLLAFVVEKKLTKVSLLLWTRCDTFHTLVDHSLMYEQFDKLV